MRVEQMERQLANLTGLVQKALTQPQSLTASRDNFRKFFFDHFQNNQFFKMLIQILKKLILIQNFFLYILGDETDMYSNSSTTSVQGCCFLKSHCIIFKLFLIRLSN